MRISITFSAIVSLAIIASFIPFQAAATNNDQSNDGATIEEVVFGKETGFKLPRFVSMKAKKGRVRRGPDYSHRIDWEFTQRGLPLMIIDEEDIWRKVQSVDGSGGWMHRVLLSGERFIIVTNDMAELKISPKKSSSIRARTHKDVIARVLRCSLNWCQIKTKGYKGWIHKSDIWGVEEDEILE